jgi:hypothetical protein
MDPKTLNNLDQNLRDKYERVMNAQATPTPASSPPASLPIDPVLAQNGGPNPSAQLSDPTLQSQSFVSSLGPDSSNTFAAAATHAFTPAYTPADSAALQNADTMTNSTIPDATSDMSQIGQSNQTNQSSSLVRIIYVLAAIVFLVLYTFVWIRIFNLQIPF